MTALGAANRHVIALLDGAGLTRNAQDVDPGGFEGVYVIHTELSPQGIANAAESPKNFEFMRRVYAVRVDGYEPEDEAQTILDALGDNVSTDQGAWKVTSKLVDPYHMPVLDGGQMKREQGGDFRILVRPL